MSEELDAAELTEAQKRQQKRRESRAAEEAPKDHSESLAKTEPVTLSVMAGDGDTVRIGGKDYEIASFPVYKLGKAGDLLSKCPEIMVSAALSAADDGTVSAEETAKTLNRLMRQVQPDAEAISGSVMEFAFSALVMSVTEEQAAAMTPLTVLALSRKHPQITEDDIQDDLDIEAFMAVLCKVFAKNPALRKRF